MILDIITMENYKSGILDLLEIPSGIDKELVKNSIFLECAEYELIYSNYDFLKNIIGVWSKTRLPIWNELYNTTKYEYDPISNYDRKEESTTTITKDLFNTNETTRTSENNGSDNTEISNTNTITKGISIKETNTQNLTTNENTGIENTEVKTATNKDTNSGLDNVRHNKYGFNSLDPTLSSVDTTEYGKITDYTRNENNKTNNTSETTRTDTGTITKDTTFGNGNDTTTDSGSNNRTFNNSVNDTVTSGGSDTGTISTTVTSKINGNIGVTTTQQMIQSQRDIVKFSIIDLIVKEFKHKFCLIIG